MPTLYHVPRTISSPIVQCLLELNLVQQGLVRVHEMTFDQLKNPDYLHHVNPMGTSPGLQWPTTPSNHLNDQQPILWESGAILDYLLETYDTKYQLHAPPPSNNAPVDSDRPRRIKYLQLKQFLIATVYPFAAKTFCDVMIYHKNTDSCEAAHIQWRKVLGPVLTRFLGRGPYLLGDKVSALDFLIAKPLSNANGLGWLDSTEDDEGFPKLKRLLERMQARPSYTLAYNSGLAQALAETTASVDHTNIACAIVDDGDKSPTQSTEVLYPTTKGSLPALESKEMLTSLMLPSTVSPSKTPVGQSPHGRQRNGGRAME